MTKIILFGAQGLLGTDVFNLFSEKSEFELVPLSRFNINVADPEAIIAAFEQHKPDVVINCAAFSDVDAAEDPELEDEVFLVNSLAPETMAEMSAKYGSRLIHISTDYVFDGKSGNYDEMARPDPVNVYGESKMEGEMGIWEKTENALIIRTSRLFGKSAENFVLWADRQARKNRPIRAVNDERGNYTFAPDLAEAIADILINQPTQTGVLHLAGSEPGSPYDIARELVQLRESRSEVIPICGADLNRAAKRPQDSSLVSTRSSLLAGFTDSLPRFLGIGD